MTRFQKSRRGWLLVGSLLVLILVIVALVALISGGRMPESNTRARRGYVQRDMQAIHSFLQDYYNHHRFFPEPIPMLDEADGIEYLIEKLNKAGGSDFSAFDTDVLFDPEFTTSEREDATADPFSPSRSFPYAYYCTESRWMVSSPGPDADYDINPKTAMENDWTTNTLDLVNRTYDPTNGTFSDGDVYRMGWPPN